MHFTTIRPTSVVFSIFVFWTGKPVKIGVFPPVGNGWGECRIWKLMMSALVLKHQHRRDSLQPDYWKAVIHMLSVFPTFIFSPKCNGVHLPTLLSTQVCFWFLLFSHLGWAAASHVLFNIFCNMGCTQRAIWGTFSQRNLTSNIILWSELELLWIIFIFYLGKTISNTAKLCNNNYILTSTDNYTPTCSMPT